MVEKLLFNLSNFVQQEFPFSLKLINYINESADAEVKQQLDRTCKYFYNEAPYLIVDNVEIDEWKMRLEHEAYDVCIDFIDDDENQSFLEKVNNIWITKKANVSLDHDLAAAFVQKIHRCDATEVSIFNAYWGLNNFKVLIESRKVEYLDINNASLFSDSDSDEDLTALEASSIISNSDVSTARDDLSHISDSEYDLLETSSIAFNSDVSTALNDLSLDSDASLSTAWDDLSLDSSTYLSTAWDDVSIISDSDESTGLEPSLAFLENILALVPNARTIRIDYCQATYRRTMKKMLSIPWKNKIIEFSLNVIDGSFCVDLFFEFVKKHVDPEAKINICWDSENVIAFKKLYNQIVLDSDEKMPMFEIADPPVVIKTFPALETEPKEIKFHDHDAERQYFAFPYPHMCYIRETADGETWKKFERTCKFFYPKNAYFMVDDFHIGAQGKTTLIVDNKKYVFYENYEKAISKRLWIINSIDISLRTGGVSKFYFSYVNRIHASEIYIRHLSFKKNLLIPLTKYGLVKQWDTFHSLIYDNDRVISLNELLIHLPNAENISAKIRGINYQNAIEPASLPQQNNVKYLELRFINEPIHAHQLYDVLTVTLAPKAMVKVDFHFMVEEMDVEVFKAQMKTKLDIWKPQIEKPSFNITL